MPGLSERLIMAFSLGLPIFVVVRLGRAWRQHQDGQLRALHDMAKGLDRIDKRIEALEHAANCNDRKEALK